MEQLIAKVGMKRATAATQQYARIWSLIFGHTDGETPWVEWIPAHLNESSVGVGLIGDGTPLTREQWMMNQLVDRHAKTAARQVRHSVEARKDFHRERNEVARLAVWVARATVAANQGKEWPYRDSLPTARPRGLQARGRRRKKPEEVMLRPIQLGGHQLERLDSKVKCAMCKKMSSSLARMARGRCKGAAAVHWANRARILGGCGGSYGAGHMRAA